MTIQEYQKYVEEGANPIYDTNLSLLGLLGEVGELCEVGRTTEGAAGRCLQLEESIGKLCDVIKKVHIYSDMSKFEAKYGMSPAAKIQQLAEEAGEHLDMLRIEAAGDLSIKPVRSWNEADQEEVLSEAGDCLWQLALVLSKFQLTFDQVIEYNVEKLNKRHGGAGKTAVDGGGVRG